MEPETEAATDPALAQKAPTKKKPPSRGTFTCEECGSQFSRREYVQRHRRLKHDNSRPFQCSTCDHAFARSDLLRRHAKSCNKKAVGGGGVKVADTPGGVLDDVVTDLPVISPLEQAAYLEGVLASAANAPYAIPVTGFEHHPAFSYGSSSSSSLPSLSPNDGGGLDHPSASSVSTPQDPPSPYSPDDFTLFSLTAAHHAQDRLLDPSTYADTVAAEEAAAEAAVDRSPIPEFTQDEILASEVLEDLLRSPQSRYMPSLGNSFSSFGDTLPWHGATAQTGASNESVAVIGSDEGDMSSSLTRWGGSSSSLSEIGGDALEAYHPSSNGIEFSPEATAIADYFAKGGVGGITALDLGFTYEPSLYPDHLFESTIPETPGDKFFLDTQRFCIGYLFPWHVPPLRQLSAYAARAASSFLPSIPVVHTPSMVLAEMPTHSAFALTVVGAAYEVGGEQFSNEMLVEKRVYLVRNFNKEGSSDDEKFSSLQSMLLYQLLGLFHRDEQQRLLSHTFHGALVMMLRQLSLPARISQTYMVEAHPRLEGEVLEASWRLWVKVETWRRVAFIVLLADLETATHFNTAPLLPFSELTIDLPSSDRLWQAKTATAWLALRLAPSTPRSISFLDAIRALLSPAPPQPYTPDGMLLTELGRLSPFPLLILSRTLSFLEMKTKEALNQVDPFRSALGGLGLFEEREKENQLVLERIQRGREILKSLPGGVQRGGGEKWYEGVMPTSHPADHPGRGEGNVSGQGMQSEEDDEEAREREKRRVSREKEQFIRNIAAAKKLAEDQWPEFMNVG